MNTFQRRLVVILGLAVIVNAVDALSLERRKREEGAGDAPLVTPPAFIEEALRLHNNYRALHHVPDLVLNQTLNEVSQAYANKLATIGKEEIGHNPDAPDLGENLFFFKSSKLGKVPNIEKTVAAWYEENKDYNYKTGEGLNDEEYKHFTQVVWKATTQMGISYASTTEPDAEGKYIIFIVANYFPKGNQEGAFTENVLCLNLSDCPQKPADETKKGDENPGAAKTDGNAEKTQAAKGKADDTKENAEKDKQAETGKGSGNSRLGIVIGGIAAALGIGLTVYFVVKKTGCKRDEDYEL